MLGMCGRQQHERRRALSPTDCAPTNQTPELFVPDYKVRHGHETSRRAFVARNEPPARRETRGPRSRFDANHPAEAEMVRSVVGGTARAVCSRTS